VPFPLLGSEKKVPVTFLGKASRDEKKYLSPFLEEL